MPRCCPSCWTRSRRSGDRHRYRRRCLRRPKGPRRHRRPWGCGNPPTAQERQTLEARPRRGPSTLSSDQWRAMRLYATRSCAYQGVWVEASGDDGEGPARHRFEGSPERCHRRSRAETRMHPVKLLGQRLSARNFGRQVAQFQVRVAVLNGFSAPGTPITEVAGEVGPGKGESRAVAVLCYILVRSPHPEVAHILCRLPKCCRVDPREHERRPVAKELRGKLRQGEPVKAPLVQAPWRARS